MTETIDLGYRPRSQFIKFHQRKQRWACLVVHRRAGKTVACIADKIDAALRCTLPDGRFGYVAPTYAQAKDVAWLYLKRFTANIPGVEQRESDLSVNFPNKARIRLYGADNYDRLRGLYLDGVTLDEYADMDPRAWTEVIRPALSDRGGWATFIGTPKGRNGFYRIHRDAKDNHDWFSLLLRASESGLIAQSELDDAKRLIGDDKYEQEFECNFEAAVTGAYFGKLMGDAEKAGRVCGVPYDTQARVWTAWDLGIGDSTAIWFAQVVGRETHLIDYYEASGVDLGHYVRELEKRGYHYAGHILPHDVLAKELGTGKSRLETLEGLGMRTGQELGGIDVCTNHRVEDGINAVRTLLPRCWFDINKCDRGIDALKLYRSDWDEKNQVLKPRPIHDWTSHAADAFRYLAMMLDRKTTDTGFSRKLNYGHHAPV